jgi:DNA polymerase III epsilon subunit-like protein
MATSKQTLFIIADFETTGVRTPGLLQTEHAWRWKESTSRHPKQISEVIEIAAYVWRTDECLLCDQNAEAYVNMDVTLSLAAAAVEAEQKSESVHKLVDSTMGGSRFHVLVQTDYIDQEAYFVHRMTPEDTKQGLSQKDAWSAFWTWVGGWSEQFSVVLLMYCPRLLDIPMILYHSELHGLTIPQDVCVVDAQAMLQHKYGIRRPTSLATMFKQCTAHGDSVVLHRAWSDVVALGSTLYHSFSALPDPNKELREYAAPHRFNLTVTGPAYPTRTTTVDEPILLSPIEAEAAPDPLALSVSLSAPVQDYMQMWQF